MKLPRVTLPVALAIAAILQTLVLGWMVVDRTRLLTTGQEIVLPIVPVDPRDLFRGQYVRLSYEVSSVPLKLVEGPHPQKAQAFYVTLEQQADGTWRPLKLTLEKPKAVGDKQLVFKGRPLFHFPTIANSSVFVRYGIERYFVPEGEGPRLEALARDKKLAALIAVDKSGTAAIKGIVIDGKVQYSERLL